MKSILFILLVVLTSISTTAQDWHEAMLSNFKMHSPLLGDTQDDTWQACDISLNLNNSKVLIKNKKSEDIEIFSLINYKDTDVEINSKLNVKYSLATYTAKSLPIQDSQPCLIGIKRATTLDKDKATTVYNNDIVSISVMCNTPENGGWVAYSYFFISPFK